MGWTTTAGAAAMSTVVAFDPTSLNLPTAREWLADTEPHVLDLMTDPERALIEDTERAAKVAQRMGFPKNARGRYAMVVWMQVYST